MRTLTLPHSPYGKFAGRDATRAFALTSLDDEHLENTSIDDIDDLSTLNEWIVSFEQKYDVVGWIDTDDVVQEWEETNAKAQDEKAAPAE